MMIASLLRGFAASTRHVKIAVAFWLSTLVLAAPAALAFASWWGAVAYLPRTDVLARRADLGVLIDMAKYNDVSGYQLIFAALAGTLGLALLVNALLAGGALDLLVSARGGREAGVAPDRRRFSHRFLRGAGHFFWRSLILLVLTLFVAAVAVSLVAAVVGFALRPFEDSLRATVSWTRLGIQLGSVALAVVFFCGFVLDYARIDMVRSDRRNAARSWWLGLSLAVRRFWTTLGVWIVVAVLCVLVTGFYRSGFAQLLGTGRSSTGVTFLALQALLIALAWLRVSVLGAEVDIAVRTQPDRAPASAPGPAPAAREGEATPSAVPPHGDGI